MQPKSVWQAMARPGFLVSSWPWRAVGYLVSGVVVGSLVFLLVVLLAVAGGGLASVLVGLPLLAALALTGLPVGRVERLRLRIVDAEPVPDPHRVPVEPGLRAWVVVRIRERATWRELGYVVLFAGVLWPLDALVVVFGLIVPLSLVATPSLMAAVGGGREAKVLKVWTVTDWPTAFGCSVGGVVLLALGAYVLGVAAGARAGLTRLLIAARDVGLGERVVELALSRGRLVDAFEAERRRIERDLHDGAQQRLVALTVTLGVARLDAPPGPLADQLAKAQEQAGSALAELRELIHGIHPQVLTDYGLEAAVADAADRTAVPVDVGLDLPGRLPRAVESAAYFVVCEALTNVDRHSGATRAEVGGGHRDGLLLVEVRDDGCGGADPARGSGLTGLADRVSVLDGRLSLSSPPGGPTSLRVEIPCEWDQLTDRGRPSA
ncbi:sensor histidine kinase [Streptomyces geranii]|uniref:sensor histidine kinase n=1 Tax=Streptomyces geranii TaxID=2058923 RepID=UPI001E2A3B2A|nr:sensor domain-containing protein [Streptomyces geranii]